MMKKLRQGYQSNFKIKSKLRKIFGRGLLASGISVFLVLGFVALSNGTDLNKKREVISANNWSQWSREECYADGSCTNCWRHKVNEDWTCNKPYARGKHWQGGIQENALVETKGKMTSTEHRSDWSKRSCFADGSCANCWRESLSQPWVCDKDYSRGAHWQDATSEMELIKAKGKVAHTEHWSEWSKRSCFADGSCASCWRESYKGPWSCSDPYSQSH